MASGTILVADDDNGIRTVLEEALTRAGYDVRTTGNVTTLWRWIEAGDGDLVIADVVMPDGNGLDLLPRIKQHRPSLPIIIMSAQNTLLTAIRATERGAYEYLPKPFDLTELGTVVARGLQSVEERSNQSVASSPEEDDMPFIGRSPAMQNVYRIIARLMSTDLTVLIFGESGTGKELVASALHEYGKRKNGPLVAINMAAIPRELVESELFGHERGSFTGAHQRKSGRFEQAEGGTLFLDEIGDMSLEAQTRLLRVLQSGEYMTVGGTTAIKTNVRIVAATNKDLRKLISDGTFREDLYFRLAVVPIHVPALRERRSDIPDFVHHFLRQAVENGMALKTVDGDAMALLKAYDWPGNVRELENLVQRLAALYTEDVITGEIIRGELASTLPQEEEQKQKTDSLQAAVRHHLTRYFDAHSDELPPSGLYDRILREIEQPLISLALEATRGNQLRAAELLGLNRNTLRKKIKDLEINVVRGIK